MQCFATTTTAAVASLLAATMGALPAPPLVASAHAGPPATRDGDSLARLFRLRERVRPPAPTPARRRSLRGPAHACFDREIETAITAAARRYRIDADLIRAVISVESAGDPRAVSSKGARGLMQVMPATGRDLGVHDPALLFDVHSNVGAGTRYLRYTYDRFGNWPDALAAYNAGPGAIARGRMPSETRHYIRRVLARHHAYSALRCS